MRQVSWETAFYPHRLNEFDPAQGVLAFNFILACVKHDCNQLQAVFDHRSSADRWEVDGIEQLFMRVK